jgi:hypothetical protein
MKSKNVNPGRESLMRNGRTVVIVKRLGMSRRQSYYECQGAATGAVIDVLAVETVAPADEPELDEPSGATCEVSESRRGVDNGAEIARGRV